MPVNQMCAHYLLHIVGVSDVSVQVSPKSLNNRWRKRTLNLGPVEVTVSLKFCPHPIGPPSPAVQSQHIFCVPIETVAQ